MDEILKSIDTKMNVIISLLLNLGMTDDKKITDGEITKKLSDSGLNNSDIGDILGESTKQVRDLLYVNKKRKK